MNAFDRIATPSTQVKPAASPAPARRGPVELQPHQLALVAGGLPKGGWAIAQELLPKGGWA